MSEKNIVICCDGTSNDVVGNSTNVLRIYRSLERNEKQLTFYDSGVGTLPDPTKYTKFGKDFSRKLDMAIGHSVRENVCQAYQFLARHYVHGDRVFLYGFSRGAYTVRALTGLIKFLGLVRPELDGLSNLAWTIFANKDFAAGHRFKHSFALPDDVRIHFVGVWDTVSAFGWLTNYKTVPYSSNNPSIVHVRHAMAIDERRACFPANYYRPGKPDQHESFKQLWFAGSHSDVGGGYPEAENGLAKVTLEWMYDESAAVGCLLSQNQIDFFLGRIPHTPPQKVPDPHDEVHNSIKGFWHIMEFMFRKQWDHDKDKMRWYLPNVYRRRKIEDGAKFHVSVQTKLNGNSGYKPSNMPDNPEFTK